MTQFLIFLIIYLMVQFFIVFLMSKKIKNERDYLVGGNKIPSFLLMFSLFATWFGAETCIGTSGEVYQKGLSGGRADPFGYSLCLILLGLLIAKKIWSSNYITLGDFFRHRFGENTEKLASLVLLISSVVWGAAQLRALSQVISSSTSLPLNVTFGIAFLFILSYCTVGGLIGDIYNDFVQGTILIIGLSVLLYSVLKSEGLAVLFQQTPQRLSFLSTDESLWQRMDRWAVPIFGSLIAQESISRLLAARNPSKARSSAFYSGVLYFFVGSIPVLLGLLGPAVLPGLTDKEQFLTSLSQKYLNVPLQFLMVGALVAAILSTVDSILLSGGGLLSHNLVIPLLKNPTEKLKLAISRLAVFVISLVVLIIAWFSQGIYQLVESASSLGTAGLLVVTLFGLWSSIGNGLAAIITLILGLFFHPFADQVLTLHSPFISTLLVCIVCYLILSWTTRFQFVANPGSSD